MKFIDKFLKKLNTSRNTFATYLLTLITIYITIDRIVEILFMIFTGVSHSYWGPFKYTLALACPLFAFLFSGSSAYSTYKNQKVTIFYVYSICFYIITVSMFTQWLNMAAWLFLINVPDYVDLITNFSDIVKPAFISLSLYLPLVSIFPMFKWLYFNINDSKNHVRSIWDYGGINLSDKKEGHGPYTCEMYLCINEESGKEIKIPEVSRYQPMFICGGTGTGKTSAVLEPMMARDIERKYFFREVSKELGFTALKTKIAVLNKPYDNEYLNKNFSLNMLSPAYGKDTVYKAFMKKIILNSSDTIKYKNVGITLLSPDYDVIGDMIDVCNNFGISYQIIDPSNPNSIGLNPFVYDDPAKIAITISSAIKGMYTTQHNEIEEAYREDIAIQAIENLAVILKEMYPRMHDGLLPNLEDMLKMFTNFDLVEKMCQILAHDEDLAQKYSVQLAYFKKHFYKTGSARNDTEKYIYSAVTQLDNLLRLPGVKTILCNRYTNINFDDMLENGEITFVCTRRGDLGATTHKAFGLFFLLAMQNAVLRRPGSENSRIPNFLYIDEFPDFLGKATEPLFTMYRKYKVGTIITAQNLSQLDTPSVKEHYRETILSNCSNKIFTGNAEFSEIEWWSKELGKRREWTMKDDMHMKDLTYDEKHGDVKWEFVDIAKPGKLQTLKNNTFLYKIRSDNGKPTAGIGKFKYLESKYKEPQKIKKYDFNKFSNTDSVENDDDTNTKKKFNLKNINFEDERNEINPVQTDVTDSSYLFDNEDAIIVNLKKGNPNND